MKRNWLLICFWTVYLFLAVWMLITVGVYIWDTIYP